MLALSFKEKTQGNVRLCVILFFLSMCLINTNDDCALLRSISSRHLMVKSKSNLNTFIWIPKNIPAAIDTWVVNSQVLIRNKTGLKGMDPTNACLMSNKMHSAGKIFIMHSEVKSGLADETHFAHSYFLL